MSTYRHGEKVLVLKHDPKEKWEERKYVVYVEEEPIFQHIVKDEYGRLESYEEVDIKRKSDFIIHIANTSNNKYQPILIIADQSFKIDYKCDTTEECEWMIDMLQKAISQLKE